MEAAGFPPLLLTYIMIRNRKKLLQYREMILNNFVDEPTSLAQFKNSCKSLHFSSFLLNFVSFLNIKKKLKVNCVPNGDLYTEIQSRLLCTRVFRPIININLKAMIIINFLLKFNVYDLNIKYIGLC